MVTLVGAVPRMGVVALVRVAFLVGVARLVGVVLLVRVASLVGAVRLVKVVPPAGAAFLARAGEGEVGFGGGVGAAEAGGVLGVTGGVGDVGVVASGCMGRAVRAGVRAWSVVAGMGVVADTGLARGAEYAGLAG
ncbi:hypothetical protein AB0F42_04895 [Streptomyces buecherae]|uniref:hypothetical protein n=1 Tax=Streptomyces buecherae TaxID=2763006 RepID=UPI0033E8E6E7